MVINFACDESGNTGVNFCDLRDPYFVVGGWIDIKGNIKNNNFKDDINKILGFNEEIKSIKLLKSNKGRKKTKELLDCMINYGFIPAIAIVDKSFAISCRIVDELLDPEYNNLVPLKITRDELEISKYDLAIMIDKIDKNILFEFAEAYRRLDVENMKNVIEKICEELKKYNNNELMILINNSLLDIERNLSDSENSKKEQAPNIYGLYVLLNMLSKFGIENNKFINVIHDEQLQYGENIDKMVKLTCKDIDAKIRYNFKEEDAFFRRIKNLSFMPSIDCDFIQYSDILVGTSNYLLKRRNLKLDNSEKNLDILIREIYKISTENKLFYAQINYKKI